MASRLADILNQEYKSKGLISGASSALEKRAKEKYDFRNILFGGSGIGSIVGRKVFGKGYSATDKESKIKVGSKISEESSALGTGTSSVLQEISTNSKTTAQNTMALPRMADDMSVMKDNIIRLAGGRARGRSGSSNRPSASLRASNFFSKSKESENAYESKFGKKTSPTKIESKKDDSGILGIIGGILGVLGAVFGTLATTVGLAVAAFTTLISGLSLFGGAILGVLGFIGRFLPFGKIGKVLGLVGLGGLALNAFGKTAANTTPGATETGKEEKSGLVKGVVNTAAGIGGTLAAGSAISGATKLLSTGAGSLREKTSTAMLDAKTTSVGQLAGSTPTSLWGRFMHFLANRKTLLFRKVGLRLATAGALLAIPVVGWVIALVQLGFSLFTAYEIYEAWKEFTDEEDKEAKGSPTQVASEKSTFSNAISSGISTFNNKLTSSNEASRQSKGLSPTSPSKVEGSEGSKKSIEEYLGRSITEDEYDVLTRAVYAEASRNKEEYANVMAVILNRARKRNSSIIDVLNEKNQFQAVTGPGSTANFQKGPDGNSLSMINESTSSLSGISKNLDSFTSANPNAYKDVGGISKFNQKMTEMKNNNGKQIGQTMFAENLYGGSGKKITPEASVASSSGSKFQSYAQAKTDAKKSGDVIIANNNNNNGSQAAPAQQTASSGAPSPYDNELAKILFAEMTL